MDELIEIEKLVKELVPDGYEIWKPKFDRVRAVMISPRLKQALKDVVMNHEPWDPPFEELRHI